MIDFSARAAARSTAGANLISVLRATFDLFALNLVLLVACLPIVTLPAALQAGVAVLDRRRREPGHGAVREFVAALRSRPLLDTTLSAGVPLAAAGVALEEVHFFSLDGTAVNSLCLGLGVAGLLLSLASSGYVLVLGARRPDLAPTELWSMSVSLALRNVIWPSPLLVAEFGAVALLLLRDPLLALVGLPLASLALARLTADLGIRRAGRGRGGDAMRGRDGDVREVER